MSCPARPDSQLEIVMLYPLLRPILFQLDPETAHNLTMRMLRISHGLRLLP